MKKVLVLVALLFLIGCSGARQYQPYIYQNCVIIGGEKIVITDEQGRVKKVLSAAAPHIEIKEIKFEDEAKTEIKVEARVDKGAKTEADIGFNPF